MEANQKKKIIGITVGVLVLAVIVACGIIFYVIPMSKYKKACEALEKGNFDKAYQMFTELENFKDSETMALETQYQKALDFQGKYKYQEAYELFQTIESYRDVDKKLDECIYEWTEYVASSSGQAEKFAAAVQLEEKHYKEFYARIIDVIDEYDQIDYWIEDESKDVHTLLKMLPDDYQETETYINLFETLMENDYESLFKRDVMEKVWSVKFMQDYYKWDECIDSFLEGFWCTEDGAYAISFLGEEERFFMETSLPWVESGNADYYKIRSLILAWEDGEENEVAKVYKFEITGLDTMKVYCYKDKSVHELYRILQWNETEE